MIKFKSRFLAAIFLIFAVIALGFAAAFTANVKSDVYADDLPHDDSMIT